MQHRHQAPRRSPNAYDLDDLTGSYDSRLDPYADDFQEPKRSRAFGMLKRVASSTVVIMSLIVVLVLVVVGKTNFGKGKPPPGAADHKTNQKQKSHYWFFFVFVV